VIVYNCAFHPVFHPIHGKFFVSARARRATWRSLRRASGIPWPCHRRALLLAACGKGAEAPKAAPAAPPGGGALPVTMITVAPQRVPDIIEAVGQTEGSKDVEVRARVSGILEKTLYKEGDRIKAGAPLFQIDRAPFENALAQARGRPRAGPRHWRRPRHRSTGARQAGAGAAKPGA
jgi:multidrug efflux pump subunit AcrA (membrane-fusion protein)